MHLTLLWSSAARTDSPTPSQAGIVPSSKPEPPRAKGEPVRAGSSSSSGRLGPWLLAGLQPTGTKLYECPVPHSACCRLGREPQGSSPYSSEDCCRLEHPLPLAPMGYFFFTCWLPHGGLALEPGLICHPPPYSVLGFPPSKVH